MIKAKALTAEQWSSVPCPTCGVGVGETCVSYVGALCDDPHVDRKYDAFEAAKPMDRFLQK
jgi:hypothetical protein